MYLRNFLYCFLITMPLLFTFCESSPYKQGEALYNYYCANCHMEDGSGLAGLIPPLAKADFVKNNPSLLPCIIRYGMEGEVVVNDTVYNQPMTGIPEITDFEITNIINYIYHTWGNGEHYAKLEAVKQSLDNCR